MRPTHPGSFRAQADLLRRQFLQDGGLPFTDVLTERLLAEALAAVGGWLDRIFSPLVTLWVFLGQVLSPDHSCRAAVARLNAHRVARGQRPCSARTGAYCRARQRLPEAFFSAAACSVGRGPGRPGRAAVAVEGAAGVPVRRHDGHHAGHPGEPGGLPAGVQPEAGPRVPDRPPRGGHLAGVRGGREPRVLPVRRQGTG